MFIEAKDGGGGSDNWTTGAKSCKAPVKSSPPTNQHPVYYRPDALPVAQPTVSKHWREILLLFFFITPEGSTAHCDQYIMQQRVHESNTKMCTFKYNSSNSIWSKLFHRFLVAESDATGYLIIFFSSSTTPACIFLILNCFSRLFKNKEFYLHITHPRNRVDPLP